MIDLSKMKWDLSKEEQYLINWLEDNGFSAILEKQYVSKTLFTVSKNDVLDKIELPHGVKGFDVKRFVKQYEKQFDNLCELQKLREQAKMIIK